MSTFSLQILACNKIFYNGECEVVVFQTYDGEIAIMAHHEQMTATVEVGQLRFKTPDGIWHQVIVSDGLVEVENNKVNFIVYSAEKPEEIDTFRAEAALERAREKLQKNQSVMEYHINRASMARAMVRLKYAGKYTPK